MFFVSKLILVEELTWLSVIFKFLNRKEKITKNPDDKKYQDLNKTMLAESEKMSDVVGHKDEQGALEDAQWQVRRLRHTCAVCHKHLGIHLYPQLYPGKKDELNPGQEEIPAPKATGVPKDW